MGRTLLGAKVSVKQCTHWRAACLVLAIGCGGAAPEVKPPDPLGARVAQCIAPPVRNAAVEMIDVPAGLAVLGSTEGERAAARQAYGRGGEQLFGNEARVRRSRLNGFRLDKHPVTQGLYTEFAAACGVIPPEPETLSMEQWEELRRAHGLVHGYAAVQRFLWYQGKPLPGREEHPMVLINHEDASFYCAWRGARLPTEEEWERASRGPNGNTYPWGNRYDPFRHNGAVRGTNDTIEVGSLPQGNTPTGFTDMGGHVFEWTSSPWPRRANHFVVKGSGWNGRGGYGRGAARDSRAAEVVDVMLGFRCAADLQQ